MPKLPVDSAKQFVKAASKLGYGFVRQSGSHIILKNKQEKLLVIPNHKRLKERHAPPNNQSNRHNKRRIYKAAALNIGPCSSHFALIWQWFLRAAHVNFITKIVLPF